MSTCLFPNVAKQEIVERLAGVPAGTHELLDKITYKYGVLIEEFDRRVPHDDESWEERRDRLEYRQYRELRRTEHTRKLNDFVLFGWGRLTAEAAKVIEHYGDCCSNLFDGGSELFWNATADEELCADILRAQGVTLPEGVSVSDLNGLYWF